MFSTFIIIFFFFSFTFWIFGFLITKSRPLLGLCISFFVHRCLSSHTILIFLCLKSVHVFTSWKQKYTRLLKSSIDISCISHFYWFTVMDTSFHAPENDFICEDCGKCLKSRSSLRRHRLRKHLKQEIKFKCTTDSCTAAFCEKGELLAHQTSHGEQKRITCSYCNHKLSINQSMLFPIKTMSQNYEHCTKWYNMSIFFSYFFLQW